jgi:hypothetical protein
MEEQRSRWDAEEALRLERLAARMHEGQQRRGAAASEAAAAATVAAAVASATHGAQIQRGLAEARAETAEALVQKNAAVATTVRVQERREARVWEELNRARAEVESLRTRVGELESQAPNAPRQVLGRHAGAMDEEATEEVPVDLTFTLVSPRLNTGTDFTARELEYQRRIVDECGIPCEAYAKANALFLQKLLGDEMHKDPRVFEVLGVGNRAAESAFYTMGMRDADIEAARGDVDPSPVAVGMDGGNKGRAMNLIAISLWCYVKRKPYLQALACSDLLGDQTAKHAAAVVQAALARGKRRPGRLVQCITDGASAATAESAAVVAGQQAKAAEERAKGAAGLPAIDMVKHAVTETCAIHGKVLEENHGLEAAFPGRALEDCLRLFHELFASAEATLARVLRHIWVTVAKLPAVLYDKHLASIPLATASKWEIIFKTCFKLLPILMPHSMHEHPLHRRTPMLELFLEKCRAFLRGDLTVDGTKVAATVVAKVKWLSGVLYEGQLVGGVHLVVDMWEQTYHKFFQFAKSSSQYGGFDSPHLRHMIAERAFEDTAWYTEARKNPKVALPRFHKHAATLSGDKQRELEARAAAFLKAAEESHMTWNGTTWTQAQHLMGFLCLEPRRSCFAAALLKHMGTTGVVAVAPRDNVDQLMLDRLGVHADNGSLNALIEQLQLKKPAVLAELRLLAAAPPQDTATAPVLSLARTPCMYSKFIPLLFVGFAHNLRIESFVSVLGKLEKAHPSAASQLIDFMFTYRTGRENERERRRAANMRSTTGGGARAAAREQATDAKELGKATRSKKQQKLLQRQSEQRAARYDNVRRRRGKDSVAQQRKRLRGEFDQMRDELDKVKFERLTDTCAVTSNGNARRAALTAQQCSLLVPQLHAAAAKVASGRGNCFKQAKMVTAGLARLKAQNAQQKQTAARLGRKRPLNERERRQAADERPEQRLQPARRKRGSTIVEEESDDEYMGEEPDSEVEEEGVGVPPGAHAATEEETEEQRAQAAERTRRADLVRTLRADAAVMRTELNALRGGNKFPTDPVKLTKYRKLITVYKETKERLQCLDA